ncbi:MAG: glycosyl hydrolase [Planctomycetota bacterium]|jgi:hypothetical protein
MNENIEDIYSKFKDFPAEYSMAPLWYWNDYLREDEILRQLKELKEKHVNEVMIWAMAGLQQQFLGTEYLDMIRFAVREAQKLDMKIWFYDDYVWPSGVAGGVINEKYPEYLMSACRFYRYCNKSEREVDLHQLLPTGKVLSVEAKNADTGEKLDITDCVDDFSINWTSPAGEWHITACVVVKIQHTLDCVTASRWANNIPGYLDTMNREAVAKFLELVYEKYYDAVPEEFGKTIKGFFADEMGFKYDFRFIGGRHELGKRGKGDIYTESLDYPDEPEIYGLFKTVPWTRDLLLHFRKRYGYELKPYLMKLSEAREENRKVCLDFYRLIDELFSENFSVQIAEWCEKHNVAFTGHFGEGIQDGDHYRQVHRLQVPGIDILGNMAAAVKLFVLPAKVASAARITGQPRVLCETYGHSHWETSMAEKIRIANIATAMGINLHAPIDYAYSFRSFRKHTANPPGFYQSTFWKYQKHLSDHIARFCQVITEGKSAVTTAVLHPSEGVTGNTLIDKAANAAVEYNINKVFKNLLDNQIQADILYETAIADLRKSSVSYKQLIICGMQHIHNDTVAFLEEFLTQGGTLVVMGSLPAKNPEGEKLKDFLKISLEKDVITKIEELPFGKGKIILLPDPENAIKTSSPIVAGDKTALIDKSNRLTCLNAEYPHWLSFDLGRTYILKRLVVNMEAQKSDITYQVRLEVSDDDSSWEKVFSGSSQGIEQQFDLLDKKASFLRINYDQASRKAFLGFYSIGLYYINPETGNEFCWTPEGYDPQQMANVIPEAVSKMRITENGYPAANLLFNQRIVGDSLIISVVNSAEEKRNLSVSAEKKDIDIWDLACGSRARLPEGREGDARSVIFEPGEAKVFVLGQSNAEHEFKSLEDLKQDLSCSELKGPWNFRCERKNALPLSALNLQMADPARPELWYEAEGGRIPEKIRLVPQVLFRCDFNADYLAGDEEILFEEGVLSGMAVNGEKLQSKAEENYFYDAFGRSHNIDHLLIQGKNIVTGLYHPEIFERTTKGSCYNEKHLQPTMDAYLLGSFALNAEVNNCLTVPPETLDNSPWQLQGYSCYTGGIFYKIEIPRHFADSNIVLLEAECRENIMEVFIDGESVKTCVQPPFTVDITEAVRAENFSVEIKITNPIWSAYAVQDAFVGKEFGCHTPNPESGLKKVNIYRK